MGNLEKHLLELPDRVHTIRSFSKPHISCLSEISLPILVSKWPRLNVSDRKTSPTIRQYRNVARNACGSGAVPPRVERSTPSPCDSRNVSRPMLYRTHHQVLSKDAANLESACIITVRLFLVNLNKSIARLPHGDSTREHWQACANFFFHMFINNKARALR
jgi:hypothetical protein